MLEELDVVGVRHRERVVRRDRAAVVVEALEQREVDDPEEVQSTLVHRRAAELEPQRAEHVVDEPSVPPRRPAPDRPASAPSASDNPSCSLSLRNFATGDSSAPCSTHPHPHQPGGAELLGPVDELVDLGPRHRALAREPHALHRRRLEGAELGGGEHLAEVAELHPEAHVGLVGAVDLHRVVPGHPLDGAGTRRR